MLTYDRLNAILQCNNDPFSYSGRFMYGRKCLAIQTEDNTSLLKTMAELILDCEDVDEASTLLSLAKTDNLGLGTVIYWPSLRVIENENEI